MHRSLVGWVAFTLLAFTGATSPAAGEPAASAVASPADAARQLDLSQLPLLDGADAATVRQTTALAYDVKAQVGGKIAQLGARLIDATAKQMADAFFDRFAATVGAAAASADAATPPPPPAPAPSVSLLAMIPDEPFGFPIVAWVGGAIWLVILLMLTGLF